MEERVFILRPFARASAFRPGAWMPPGVASLFELQFPLNRCDDGTPELGEPELITHFESSNLRGPVVYLLGCETLAGNRFDGLNPDDDDAALLTRIDAIIQELKVTHEQVRMDAGRIIQVCAMETGGVRLLRNETAARPLSVAIASRIRYLFERKTRGRNLRVN
jgi:hypothetical protein